MDIVELYKNYEVVEKNNLYLDKKGVPQLETYKTLKVEVDPEVLYPTMVGYLKKVQSGEVTLPQDIMYRNGTINADPLEIVKRWRQQIAKVTDDVWQDALTPRSEFPALPTSIKLDWLIKVGGRSIANEEAEVTRLLDEAGIVDGRDVVLRLARRAYALELALGWFQEATRVKSYELCGRIGANINISKNLDYKLL